MAKSKSKRKSVLNRERNARRLSARPLPFLSSTDLTSDKTKLAAANVMALCTELSELANSVETCQVCGKPFVDDIRFYGSSSIRQKGLVVCCRNCLVETSTPTHLGWPMHRPGDSIPKPVEGPFITYTPKGETKISSMGFRPK